MTVEKGLAWGEPWSPAPGIDLVEVVDDAALAQLVTSRRDSEVEALVGSGDLLRTIGLDAPRPSAGGRHRYPIDVGLAHLRRDAAEPILASFVAHLTVRNRPLTGLGPGLSVAVMNAAWLGELRLGPRAHPNDGLVDVVEGTVGLLQRREGNRRARSGTHVPHPGLRSTRVARWERRWSRPVPVWLDGVRVGRFAGVTVEVIPDAAVVVA